MDLSPTRFASCHPSVHMHAPIWECMYTYVYYISPSLYPMETLADGHLFRTVSHQMLWPHVRVCDLTPLIIVLTNSHLFRRASSVVCSPLRRSGPELPYTSLRDWPVCASLTSASQDLPTPHPPSLLLTLLFTMYMYIHVREYNNALPLCR